jgi:hypothetical protein
LHSTIWQEAKETKILWIAMLAMCERDGVVMASIPGLAKAAGITITECEAGLQCLLSPDPYSRTRDHEGRRIEPIDGGWRLLNHGKYKEQLSYEERKEYNRKKQAERREKLKQQPKADVGVNDMSMTVNDNQQCQHIPDTRYQIPFILSGDAAKKKESKGPKSEPNPRPRNLLMDAMATNAELSDPAQVSEAKWKTIGTALAQIRKVCPHVTPEEIARRCENYRTHFDFALTAPSLASHWARCEHPKTKPAKKYASILD